MRRYAIGVVGDVHLGAVKWKSALALGEQLVDYGYRIVSGGHGDLAKALAEGARKSTRYRDGDLISILPGLDPSVADERGTYSLQTAMLW